jgi:hypothetical protein
MTTPDCYKCKHRREVPGSAHSACNHPSPEKMKVEGNPTGIRRGWFMWPYNYDPCWLVACDGFEEA